MAFVSVSDFEKQAKVELERNALDYYRSGAGEELTLGYNREAFKRFVFYYLFFKLNLIYNFRPFNIHLIIFIANRLRLRPRCLRNVAELETSCSIWGEHFKWPLGIAPVAMQRMAHPEGEKGTARAAGRAGCLFILSTLSNTSLEEVAAAAPETCKWFQLYIYKDR